MGNWGTRKTLALLPHPSNQQDKQPDTTRHRCKLCLISLPLNKHEETYCDCGFIRVLDGCVIYDMLIYQIVTA